MAYDSTTNPEGLDDGDVEEIDEIWGDPDGDLAEAPEVPEVPYDPEKDGDIGKWEKTQTAVELEQRVGGEAELHQLQLELAQITPAAGDVIRIDVKPEDVIDPITKPKPNTEQEPMRSAKARWYANNMPPTPRYVPSAEELRGPRSRWQTDERISENLTPAENLTLEKAKAISEGRVQTTKTEMQQVLAELDAMNSREETYPDDELYDHAVSILMRDAALFNSQFAHSDVVLAEGARVNGVTVPTSIVEEYAQAPRPSAAEIEQAEALLATTTRGRITRNIQILRDFGQTHFDAESTATAGVAFSAEPDTGGLAIAEEPGKEVLDTEALTDTPDMEVEDAASLLADNTFLDNTRRIAQLNLTGEERRDKMIYWAAWMNYLGKAGKDIWIRNHTGKSRIPMQPTSTFINAYAKNQGDLNLELDYFAEAAL